MPVWVQLPNEKENRLFLTATINSELLCWLKRRHHANESYILKDFKDAKITSQQGVYLYTRFLNCQSGARDRPWEIAQMRQL